MRLMTDAPSRDIACRPAPRKPNRRGAPALDPAATVPFVERGGGIAYPGVRAARRRRETPMIDEMKEPLDRAPDLRHRVRRLHWFRESFRRDAKTIGERYGFAFAIDDRALVEAFFEWASAFERERPDSKRDRRDFAIFSGGLMLRELLRAAPAKGAAAHKVGECIPPDPMARICEFWPEGFLYAHYCLTLVQAILEQDFDVRPAPNPVLEDLRIWQSFRENFAENPATAIGFFDVFMGQQPNWEAPEYFLSRPAVQRAGALPRANEA